MVSNEKLEVCICCENFAMLEAVAHTLDNGGCDYRTGVVSLTLKLNEAMLRKAVFRRDSEPPLDTALGGCQMRGQSPWTQIVGHCNTKK